MEAQNSKALALYQSMGYRVEQENVHYEMKL
jgi:ribosomal protein S18 acetylase RimI-like enzyme